MISRNIMLNAILRREQITSDENSYLMKNLEDSFMNNNVQKDYELPGNVLSTIAISISPDGDLVATTHGDHTVKVFKYEDGHCHRIFRGHPSKFSGRTVLLNM